MSIKKKTQILVLLNLKCYYIGFMGIFGFRAYKFNAKTVFQGCFFKKKCNPNKCNS